MAIREEIVASAAQFLQDPSVASSPVENRIAFLQAKNLSHDEVNAALARAGSDSPPQQYAAAPPPSAASPPSSGPPQAYYGQPPPYAWQQPPPEAPRRDWRDWFIMATVVGGVSYGVYALTKRYVYPLVAPPTPDRLEQDKKSIDDQFDKAFALVDQLAKDTEELKGAEQERTQRLDSALGELETVISDLKLANRRREDEAQRVRDDVKGLKDAIPKALDSQRDLTDNRLRDVNTELKSLKTLISQRMSQPQPSTPSTVGGYMRASSGANAGGTGPASPSPAGVAAGQTSGAAAVSEGQQASTAGGQQAGASSGAGATAPSSGTASPAKAASIPAWQLAMMNKGSGQGQAQANNAGSGSSTQ